MVSPLFCQTIGGTAFLYIFFIFYVFIHHGVIPRNLGAFAQFP